MEITIPTKGGYEEAKAMLEAFQQNTDLSVHIRAEAKGFSIVITTNI